MIGGTRSCRGRQTPHATAPAEQRHHHATGIRRSRAEEQGVKQATTITENGLQIKLGGFAEIDFFGDNTRSFVVTPWPFARCKTRSPHWKTQPTLPTRGAYKSCETYSLRDAGLDACAWDPQIGWMTLTILCVAHPQWEAFAHRGVQATDTVWQVAAPKLPSRPHTLWKGCQSHSDMSRP